MNYLEHLAVTLVIAKCDWDNAAACQAFSIATTACICVYAWSHGQTPD